jgi:terminase small subunit-like protein
VGRPSTFTDEIFDTICERLENGEVLRAICADDQMPDRSTVLRWIAADDGKRRRYDLARQACVEFWSDEIIQIATDGSRDTVTDEKGRARCDHEWVNRSRLRIDTIKFLMTKINPLKWGDKLPEAAAARQMEIDAQMLIAAVPPRKIEIELIGVAPGSAEFDERGKPFPNSATALRARIAELEAELAGRNPASRPPALLTHDPGPLPTRMDQDIASRMVRLIKDYVRKDDQRPPEAVLDEVLSVCRDALLSVYGPTGEMINFGAAAE